MIDMGNLANFDGKTPFHFYAEKGQLDLCKPMIDGGFAHTKDKNGDTPFQLAYKNGHFDLCTMMINSGGFCKSKLLFSHQGYY